jgi:hypothetical protein
MCPRGLRSARQHAPQERTYRRLIAFVRLVPGADMDGRAYVSEPDGARTRPKIPGSTRGGGRIRERTHSPAQRRYHGRRPDLVISRAISRMLRKSCKGTSMAGLSESSADSWAVRRRHSRFGTMEGALACLVRRGADHRDCVVIGSPPHHKPIRGKVVAASPKALSSEDQSGHPSSILRASASRSSSMDRF